MKSRVLFLLQICEKLDAGTKTQSTRVEYLKRLQTCDAEIHAFEKQIALLWLNYGDEILAASQ